MYASVGTEKLGGGSCPNRGPTGILINSFPLSCHGFVPRRAPLPTVDLPSQNLVQNRQYRDSTHRAKICQGWRYPNNMYQKWQYRDTAPTNTPTGINEQSRTPNEPKMHDNDKTCFVFRTACLCSNCCATNDDRQMRMTDKDTPQKCVVPQRIYLECLDL